MYGAELRINELAVFLNDHEVTVHVVLFGAVPDAFQEGIQSGIPAHVRFTVELWQYNRHWRDQRLTVQLVERSLVYNVVTKEFRVTSLKGEVRPVHIIDPLTLEAARNLIGHYQLGRRGVTDLLAVSLSATDFVGHGYGTQGPEMCDHVHRLDSQLGEFLEFLDGLGSKVLVVITGDHGGSDFPERLQRQGYHFAKRIDGRALLAIVNAEIKQKLGLPP